MEQIKLEHKEVEATIYNFQKWIDETSPEVLRSQFQEILENVGYTILNHIEHHFPVKGYTCLWLLAESHLAIHTFPEKQSSYIELSGCNKELNTAFELIVNELYQEH